MNRTIGGLPIIYWIGGLALGIGAFAWIKKRSASSSSSSPAAGAAAKTPSFTQAQEVQDFQIFSALTGAQQASDLNFLTEVAGLFSGGSSTGTPGGAVTGGGGGGSTIAPAPPSTGTAPPATVPASNPTSAPAPAAPAASSLPGYGSGVGELLALNPGGIPPNSFTYNGVTL